MERHPRYSSLPSFAHATTEHHSQEFSNPHRKCVESKTILWRNGTVLIHPSFICQQLAKSPYAKVAHASEEKSDRIVWKWGNTVIPQSYDHIQNEHLIKPWSLVVCEHLKCCMKANPRIRCSHRYGKGWMVRFTPTRPGAAAKFVKSLH